MDERGSAKHSQWRDDELAREADSLTKGAPAEPGAEEIRVEEAPAEEEPVPGVLHGRPDVPPAGALTPDDIEARSLLAGWLRPSTFTAHRDALLRAARAEGAEDWALALLRGLPSDVEFANVQQVWEAAGGAHEERVVPTPPPTRPPAEAASLPPAPAVEEAPARRETAPAGSASEPLPMVLLGIAVDVVATAFRIGTSIARSIRRRLPI